MVQIGSVGIVTRIWAACPGNAGYIPEKGTKHYFGSVQVDPEAQQASYPIGTEGSYPGSKATSTWSGLLTPSNADVKNVWSYASTILWLYAFVLNWRQGLCGVCGYEAYCLLGWNTIYSARSLQTARRSALLPSSEWKNKLPCSICCSILNMEATQNIIPQDGTPIIPNFIKKIGTTYNSECGCSWDPNKCKN
jgi:hypothetical protein